MLIEFSVANYLSFKDKVTFSMEASEDVEYRDSNVFTHKKYNLLKSAVIYGANSSGKSNLIKAFSTMQRLVTNSFEKPSTNEFDVTPFLLNIHSQKKPIFFEVIFSIDQKSYRYGFTLNEKGILKEWLFNKFDNLEKVLFEREANKIIVSIDFKEGLGLEKRTRNNALFLSVVDWMNGKKANNIIKWFRKFNCILGSNLDFKSTTYELFEKSELRIRLQDFYTKLGLGFQRLIVNKERLNYKQLLKEMPLELNRLPSESGSFLKIAVNTIHSVYDDEGKSIDSYSFNMFKNESTGTNKIFTYSGVIFKVLNEGGVLIIDELDASLHQLLTLEIIKLFHNKETNPNNAQLIFTTHDASLLKKDILKEEANFRNDQVYFVEKNEFEVSQLTSLYDYDLSDLKDQNNLDKHYLLGRFGAIPSINSSAISINSNG